MIVLALPNHGVLASERPLRIFAAASLSDAMTEIGRAFSETTGQPVVFSFASTSTLARQIEAGAPADIFASANKLWADYLVGKGYLEGSSLEMPITNRLVLITPLGGAEVNAEKDFADHLRDLPKHARLAVGDPDHVPAGAYARQALESAGLWSALEPRLARTDNVRGALALVDRGETPFGLVYATDAELSKGVAIIAQVPSDAHDPIEYVFGLVRNESGRSDEGKAEDLLAFLESDVARSIFRDHGFLTDELL